MCAGRPGTVDGCAGGGVGLEQVGLVGLAVHVGHGALARMLHPVFLGASVFGRVPKVAPDEG